MLDALAEFEVEIDDGNGGDPVVGVFGHGHAADMWCDGQRGKGVSVVEEVRTTFCDEMTSSIVCSFIL